MCLPQRFRTLLAQAVLWIVLPLSLLMFGMAAVGALAYQQIVVSLLVDRDRQLAALSATRVSEAAQGYARVLETLASNADLLAGAPQERTVALDRAADALEVFTAGVVLVDRQGLTLVADPPGPAPVPADVSAEDYFRSVRDNRSPEFSNVLDDARTGQDMIVIAVPWLDETGEFAGALLGAIHLDNAPLGEPVRRLVVGDEGFAYLVDGRGRVIFHPSADNIGADFSDRPSVQKVIGGETGGTLWVAPGGERLVQGYAPVEATGWGLVVREPWNAAVAPVRTYGLAVGLAALVAILVAALCLWVGARRIAAPVRLLALQTARLAAGDSVEPISESGILEIDSLEQAFVRMAAQISAYRAGQRRFVGAITKSQEDERRRIARDLHDETAQSLLAVLRRVELYRASESDPAQLTRLAELQGMIGETLNGVRQISRDLRPLALEDLGLVPALRVLVRSARRDNESGPQIAFTVNGPGASLNPEQELALYRITQEALRNAQRHARASRVQVRLTLEPAQARLEVSDDGAGFRPPASLADLAQYGHFGLMGIQERVWAVGGSLTVQATPGAGACLTVTMPVGV